MIKIKTALAVALLGAGLVRAERAGAEEPDKVPADACIVELALPDDARVRVGGRDLGRQRKLVWDRLKPQSMTSVLAEVQFAGGGLVERLLVLEPGRRVRVAIPDPGARRPELVLQTGHCDTILSLAVSADGKHVLTGARDSTAILWERASGRVLRTFAHGTGLVHQVAFNGQGLVLSRGDSEQRVSVRIWEMGSGNLVREIANPMYDITSACFSPDGKRVLLALGDRALVYELASARYVAGVIPAERGRVLAAAYSPDGSRLATAGEAVFAKGDAGTLALWDADTRTRILDFRGPIEGVVAVVFSPDGRWLAAATGGLYARASVGLWDTATGQRRHTLTGPEKGPVSLAFSPDSQALLATNGSREVYLWGVADGSRLARLAAKTFVNAAAFGTGRGEVLTGDNDQTVQVWDVAAGKPTRTFLRRSDAIESMVLSRDGRLVATRSGQGVIAVGDPLQGRAAHVFRCNSASEDGALAFSHDGRRLFTQSLEGGEIFDLRSGRLALRLERPSTEKFGDRTIRSAVFSLDGRRLYTGRSGPYREEGDVVVWDALTGKQVGELKRSPGAFSAVALSPDGRRLLAGLKVPRAEASGEVPTAFLFDLDSGQELRQWRSPCPEAAAAAFTPNGLRVLTDDWRLRDAHTGRLVSSRQGLHGAMRYFAMSRDGRWVIAAGQDTDAALWDTTTGNQVRRFSGHRQHVTCLRLSSDEGCLVAGSDGGLAIAWDVASGRRLFTLSGHTGMMRAIAFSPDDSRILSGAHDGRAILWEAATGARLRTLINPDKTGITGVAFHDDGRTLVTGGFNGSVVLWDAETGRGLRRFSPTGDPLFTLTTSPDGNRLAAASFSRTGKTEPTVSVWDLRSGRRLWQATGDLFDNLLFTPDGETLLGANGSCLAAWDAATGKEEGRIPLKRFAGNTVAASADGNRIVTGVTEHEAVVFDAQAGRAVCRIGTVGGPSVLSPDGRLAANVSANHTVTVCEAATGNRMTLLSGHSGPINALAFAPDSRTLYTASRDGTLRAWDVSAGSELAAIIGIDGGAEWLAVTPHGLFDGSEGARQAINFRVGEGLTTVPVDRFFQDFFRPGLLAELLEGARPVPTARFADKVAPRVRIVSPTEAGAVEKQEVAIEVEVTDQGGGIAGPWLMQNGTLVMASGPERRSGAVLRRTMRILLVEGENRIEIRAASQDRSWESEPALLVLKYEKPLAKPALHLLAIGVNRYAEETLNLRFAAPDARAIAGLFRARGPALYGERNVHVTELLDAKATRAAVRAAVEQVARQARPQDLLVLFLAGHGMTVGQRYYFLTHEFRRAASAVEEDVRNQGLASDVLGDMMDKVPALKRAVIYDTCQSGAALPPGRGPRDPFVFRAALERLGRSHGQFTLAAAAATEQAQEIAQLKHGMLTYTLLAGMGAVKDGPLAGQVVAAGGAGRVAGIREWFSYAQDKVPALTKLYTGQEQFVEFDARGADFPLLPLAETAGE